MMPTPGSHCQQCGLAMQHWVMWRNSAGWTHFFCDNDCLEQWLRERILLIQMQCREETPR